MPIKQIFILFILLTISSCGLKPAPTSRSQAVIYSEKKEYDKAISAYWAHIESRLAIKDRPDWENPHIYLLDIGDIYLERGEIGKALETYLLAETHNVKQEYISDRMRHVATWYEKRGYLREAIEHLKKHRHRDELLFDLMLNRLARKLVESEDLTNAATIETNNS